MPHSGWHFLRFWCILVRKCSILGTPWHPVGHQMTSKITQVAQKDSKKASGAHTFWGSWNRLASKITFGAFLGTTFVDFWWFGDWFWWIWASFSMDFGCFSAVTFAECQSRLPRNEIAANIENMQITVEICKQQAQEKTNHQTPIEILQAAECR